MDTKGFRKIEGGAGKPDEGTEKLVSDEQVEEARRQIYGEPPSSNPDAPAASVVPQGNEIPAGTVNPMVIPLQGKPCRFSLRPDGGQDLFPCRPLRAASRAHAPGITVLSMRVAGSPLPPQRVGAIARVAEGDDGVFLNFCPFCGENIHRNFKRIARELKDAGVSGGFGSD